MPFKASSTKIDAAVASADSIAATTTETAFATALALPAVEIVEGARWRLVAKLKGTSSSGTPPTVDIAVKNGTTTLLATTVTFAASQTDTPIKLVAEFVVTDADDVDFLIDLDILSAGFTAKRHSVVPTAVTVADANEDGLDLKISADWQAATGGNSLALLDAYVERV